MSKNEKFSSFKNLFLVMIGITILVFAGCKTTKIEIALLDFLTANNFNAWGEDWDDDGKDDHFFTDQDGDGEPETCEVDMDEDGRSEERWVDQDDDGDWDTRINDSDDDGDWDEGKTDRDRDGKFDHKWTDKNGNGKTDPGEVEPIDPPEPVNGPRPQS